MENTKTFITYHIATNPEFINVHQASDSFKTYSQAKQAIVDKLAEIANNANMSWDNKVYWTKKYNNAVIVESVSTYTVV